MRRVSAPSGSASMAAWIVRTIPASSGRAVAAVSAARSSDDASLGQVGAVDRERAQELRDGVAHLLGVVVAGHQGRDAPHLGDEDLVGDQAPCRVLGGGEALADARVLGGDGVDERLAARVDEQAADLAQRLVARGAVGGPGQGQRLVRTEDLLDEQPRLVAQGRAEAPQVGAGRGQAVGVVDAQAVELARGAPAQHLGVGGVEDRRVVDADRGEVGDVEEAPVGRARRCRAASARAGSAGARAPPAGSPPPVPGATG